MHSIKVTNVANGVDPVQLQKGKRVLWLRADVDADDLVESRVVVPHRGTTRSAEEIQQSQSHAMPRASADSVAHDRRPVRG